MTKAELVEFIAEKADLTKADAGRALEAMIEGITEGLKKEGNISLFFIKVKHRYLTSLLIVSTLPSIISSEKTLTTIV